MDCFLISKGSKYSYAVLLEDINNADSCYPCYQTDSLYNYYLNFLIGLLSDTKLTLLDSDFSFNETSEEDGILVNQSVKISKPSFSTMQEVVKKVQESNSKISIYSSGTTGKPKKIVHTVATLTRYVRVEDKYKNQIWGFAYNPTHMAGLQVFFQAFENLNTLVNIFNAKKEDVYEAIDRYQITHISATPTFYRLLLPFESSYNSVIRVTFGGEKSDQKLYNAIHLIFPYAKQNNIYASTEAGSLFAAKGEFFLIPKSMREKIIIENSELLIHKSLLGKSDNFIYSSDYYRTGDLIEWIDENQGLFKFTSRKDELINVGGYKVNPEEIESEILKIERVSNAIVYGRSNSVLGNILCADIKIEDGCNLTEMDIRIRLSKNLQDFKIPRKIKFVDSFSLTRTGKIKRI